MNETMSDLRSRVQDTFLQYEDLRQYGIEVLDNNGVITLRGAVPTREARDKAEAIAHQVDGVIDGFNEIDVV